MQLSSTESWSRVAAGRHGILGTIHPDRGIDLIPVVYAVHDSGGAIFVPIDTVKAKKTTRLRRLENLSRDPRCSLLVENYADDWSQLWWVRITATATSAGVAELEEFTPLLAQRYEPYREAGVIDGGIVLTPRRVVGWAAGG